MGDGRRAGGWAGEDGRGGELEGGYAVWHFQGWDEGYWGRWDLWGFLLGEWSFFIDQGSIIARQDVVCKMHFLHTTITDTYPSTTMTRKKSTSNSSLASTTPHRTLSTSSSNPPPQLQLSSTRPIPPPSSPITSPSTHRPNSTNTASIGLLTPSPSMPTAPSYIP